MTEPRSSTLELARNLIESMASTGLSPSFAKLYSQHTRLRAGQPGLAGWREEEAFTRLNDALRLVDASFIEKENGIADWQDGIRRAGELLEWLSHPKLNPEGLPIQLLSAAAYQIAGYPARAMGLLSGHTTDEAQSKVLTYLLKASFPQLLGSITEYWAQRPSSMPRRELIPSWHDDDALESEIQQWIVDETIGSLGILCSAMRWGNESRLDKALDKLNSIGKVLLHSDNFYSWLLARLCSEVASNYAQATLRSQLKGLSVVMSETGKSALERYLRLSYQHSRSLAWPSQIRGISRLAPGKSFALCTPTGSGKTTIAELAILQSLFPEQDRYEKLSEEIGKSAPLAIYLVPSRALATEVEAKLSRVLHQVGNEETIIVTGLYGGTDWGPTDAWLTAEDRTVLICTYEKAEALIRFLGPLFLYRVSLVVIDEAHSIQFDGNNLSLRTAESRSLRLEALLTRLLTHLDQINYLDPSQYRIIALSAVTAGVENTLARWIAGQDDAAPVKTEYRSTRQLIGRLECMPNRGYVIRYDLLDGGGLIFKEGGTTQGPFIQEPFPSHPPAPKLEEGGPEQKLRPYLFWAAMHLASPDEMGQQRAVLISVAQNPGGYAEDFLRLLNSDWAEIEIPSFFQPPTDPEKLKLWEKCLRSCEDYFTRKSREFRLLQKGIVVHHGKMPGLMARLLIQVIEQRIVHLVIATSTLSEGVNLPFETVLIPTLRRRQDEFISIREFSNLVGRAGRPGFGTEGRSLVLLQPEPQSRRRVSNSWSIQEARKRYFDLILTLQSQSSFSSSVAQSPLAELLILLKEEWERISESKTDEDFLKWLEQTATIESADNPQDNSSGVVIEALDSLDSILLSAIVEIEGIAGKEVSLDELERQLRQLWRRSYAHYAQIQERKIEKHFIQRGRTLRSNIYPNSSQRRRLYRTSLPPRSAHSLLRIYPEIKRHLESGEHYAGWNDQQKFDYIRTIVEHLSTLRKFELEPLRGNATWQDILLWWLNPNQASITPKPTQISSWHNYINKNFQYRLNWGIGSIVALAMDEIHAGSLHASSLEEWPNTGLPWIVFWMKELIVWGSLDPVVAYLLALGKEVTRSDAQRTAQLYYDDSLIESVSDPLNATNIRKWVKANLISYSDLSSPTPPAQLNVNLLRDFSANPSKYWRVVPVEGEKEILWIDIAGYPLASCEKPFGWQSNYLGRYDFVLDRGNRIVSSKVYI